MAILEANKGFTPVGTKANFFSQKFTYAQLAVISEVQQSERNSSSRKQVIFGEKIPLSFDE
ncbi:hypothetical protein ACTXT7_013039 [Hymenolepis weldensis]